MKDVSNRSCRENQNIHFTFNNFFSGNGAVFEIMWKNVVDGQATHDNTMLCIKDALCVLDN
jgi:hypothetical protein